MSQAGMLNGAGGPVPPTVATTYVTDFNSPAIPAVNILNVFARETADNNDEGIQSDGSSGGNTLTVELTNRQTGHVQTTDEEVIPVILFPFLVGFPGTYKFTVKIVAYDLTDVTGASFLLNGTCVSDGATGAIVGNPVIIMDGDGGVFNVDMILLNVAGPAIEVDVQGVAVTTINWGALLEYIFQGAVI